jgi:hypothetical protein
MVLVPVQFTGTFTPGYFPRVTCKLDCIVKLNNKIVKILAIDLAPSGKHLLRRTAAHRKHKLFFSSEMRFTEEGAYDFAIRPAAPPASKKKLLDQTQVM